MVFIRYESTDITNLFIGPAFLCLNFISHIFLNKPLEISEQNILYYDGIAGEYNSMLDKDSDRLTREKVATRFLNIIHNGTILDFGGGTGLDLNWLSQNNNRIFFCEPSREMRKLAISYSEDLFCKNIIFLNDDASDFRQWNNEVPFSEKADAVLANFAVLNCIPGIKLLFKILSLIMKPGGNMVALILTKKNNNIRDFLASIFYKRPVFTNIHYKDYQQTIYLYSIKQIVEASREYFDLCNTEVFKDSDFTLMHLKRK